MRLVEYAQEGLANLRFSRLRSFLALLGVLVGTASVVAMVLGGELATNEALKAFKMLGTDLFSVSLNATNEDQDVSTGKITDLTLDQALALQNADTHIANVAPYTQLFHPIFYKGNEINGSVLGVTDDFFKVLQIHVFEGRNISIADRYEFYCVIGNAVYDALKHYTYRDPLGQTLQVGKNTFVIVGIATSWPQNNFIYTDIDHAILIPILTSQITSKYALINNILMRLAPGTDGQAVEEHLSTFFNQRLTGKQVNFRSAKELIAKMKQESDILTVFLGLVGSVSLMVGGVGVMNIMLVSVTERRREIGVRLAVGAKPGDIARLFLVEAMMLSLLGGTLGVIAGTVIAYLIALIWHWEFILFLSGPLIGFSVSVAIGIFFGFYPAKLASKLDPITALRSE